MRLRVLIGVWILGLGMQACVPKTQYEDQASRLKETEAQLKSLEQSSQECDPDTFIQLKEQTQSLDVLTQELVERNTELSNEVGRLRPFEARFRDQDQQCKRLTDELKQGFEGQIQRTRATYDDLIRELESKVKKLEADLEAARAAPPSKKPGGSRLGGGGGKNSESSPSKP
jgi:hypothetical protein